jgi:hypothetical protein
VGWCIGTHKDLAALDQWQPRDLFDEETEEVYALATLRDDIRRLQAC